MNDLGLLSLFQQHRADLLRYLRAHGAGEDAEDLLQELWLRLEAAASGPIASPRSYLYRAATNLMIDHRRAGLQARRRDRAWSLAHDRDSEAVSDAPSAERMLVARQALERVRARLDTLPERARRLFVRHRIDGLTQRAIGEETGLSRSTIEADLRLVYRELGSMAAELGEE